MNNKTADIKSLSNIAKLLTAHGKGILAADDRESSANSTLQKYGIEPTLENRRRYRELFINTEGLEKFVSGIILYEETLNQNDSGGIPFSQILQDKGVLIGIKVDQGTQKYGETNEVVTLGLNGLDSRLKVYQKKNAVFTKWRAVIKIGKNMPSPKNIDDNCKLLAEYASIAQNNNMLPIVEPEVLINGTHSIDMCEEVMTWTMRSLFKHLTKSKVLLEGLILKTSMCLDGDKSGKQSDPGKVAEYTVRVLQSTVPAKIGGVVFLSGGQSSETATANLNAIAKLNPLPWEVTFSFNRAIQEPAIAVWDGDESNLIPARKIFLERLQQNSLAQQGLL